MRAVPSGPMHRCWKGRAQNVLDKGEAISACRSVRTLPDLRPGGVPDRTILFHARVTGIEAPVRLAAIGCEQHAEAARAEVAEVQPQAGGRERIQLVAPLPIG